VWNLPWPSRDTPRENDGTSRRTTRLVPHECLSWEHWRVSHQQNVYLTPSAFNSLMRCSHGRWSWWRHQRFLWVKCRRRSVALVQKRKKLPKALTNTLASSLQAREWKRPNCYMHEEYCQIVYLAIAAFRLGNQPSLLIPPLVKLFARKASAHFKKSKNTIPGRNQTGRRKYTIYFVEFHYCASRFTKTCPRSNVGPNAHRKNSENVRVEEVPEKWSNGFTKNSNVSIGDNPTHTTIDLSKEEFLIQGQSNRLIKLFNKNRSSVANFGVCPSFAQKM